MSEQQIPLSQEAIDHFDLAISLWNNTEESKRDEKWLRDVASHFALCIKKANRPLPRAHALLSWFLYEMGDRKQARSQAEIALRHNLNEFRAQETLIWLESPKSVSAPKSGIGGTEEVFVDITLLGFSMLGNQYSLHKFNREITKLVEIFRRLLQQPLEVSEFIYMAKTLFNLGDSLGDVPRVGLFGLQVADKLGMLPDRLGRPNLFREIAQAPITNIIINDDDKEKEKEVKALMQAAEGRLLLKK